MGARVDKLSGGGPDRYGRIMVSDTVGGESHWELEWKGVKKWRLIDTVHLTLTQRRYVRRCSISDIWFGLLLEC